MLIKAAINGIGLIILVRTQLFNSNLNKINKIIVVQLNKKSIYIYQNLFK